MNLPTPMLLLLCLTMVCACGSSGGDPTPSKPKGKVAASGERISTSSRPGADQLGTLDRRSGASRDRGRASSGSADPNALKADRAKRDALGSRGLQAIKPPTTKPATAPKGKSATVAGTAKAPARHMRLPTAIPVVPTPSAEPQPTAPVWDADARTQLKRRCQKWADAKKLKSQSRKGLCRCFVAAYSRKYTRAQFEAMRKRSLGSGPTATKLASSVAAIMGRCLAKAAKPARP